MFSHRIDTGLGNTRRNLAVKIQSRRWQERLGGGSAAQPSRARPTPRAGAGTGTGTAGPRAAEGLRGCGGSGTARGRSGARVWAPRGAETAGAPRPLPGRRVVRAAGEASPGRRALAGSGEAGPGTEPLPGAGAARPSRPLAPHGRSLQAVYAQPRPRAGPARPGPRSPRSRSLRLQRRRLRPQRRAGGTGRRRRRLPAASFSAAGEGAARGLC